jgi:hypothetical protein
LSKNTQSREQTKERVPALPGCLPAERLAEARRFLQGIAGPRQPASPRWCSRSPREFRRRSERIWHMPQLTARARSITEVSTAIGVNSVSLFRVLHLLVEHADILLI